MSLKDPETYAGTQKCRQEMPPQPSAVTLSVESPWLENTDVVIELVFCRVMEPITHRATQAPNTLSLALVKTGTVANLTHQISMVMTNISLGLEGSQGQ